MTQRDDIRPDPERLLAAARLIEAKSDSGRLKIFLGYAPGVGKTYTMLEAARARRRAGIEVVVGVAVTHGRGETAAMLEGLELLPEREFDHQGARLREFDLIGALKRRPAVLLVDELAHSNAPGSRHAKRWQDVRELLAAGIDVFTTVNVQHVESVHDVVQRLTGVDVRERVPDHVLDEADEIELVDFPPAELLERLRAGKVYLGEAAGRALQGFFTLATLTGLRELALRLVADRVGADQNVTARTDAGRLLVCVGPSPFSARLLRATRRMAEQLHVGWIALHVRAPGYALLDEQARARIGQHLSLAEKLGADVFTVTGEDLARTIVAEAQRHGASRIVVGKPLAPRWRDRLLGSPVFDLVRLSGDIDIYVVNGEGAVEQQPTQRRKEGFDIIGIGVALACVALATAACWLLREHLEPANLAMLYLLAVVAVAFRGRNFPVIGAAIFGVLCFDFLFVPPFFSFTVNDAQYVITFVGMLVVGLAISTLSLRLRAQADAALHQADVALALHRVSRDLATTRGTAALVDSANARCREVLGCPVIILVTDRPGSGSLASAATELVHGDHPDLPVSELAVAQWVAEHGEAAGAGTETLPGSAGWHLPLTGTRGVVGVLCCLGARADGGDPERTRLIEALTKLVGLAIECDRLAESAQETRVAIDAERLRNTLLSSVSHDLRTPLAAIAGSASTLLSADVVDTEKRHELLRTIAEQAERMGRLVGNLLEFTRLEGGAVRVRSVPMSVEDLVGSARVALRDRLVDHPVQMDVPADCPPVLVDEVLIQSVLINLLDNAVKYSPPGSPITISSQADSQAVTVTVSDRGPGLMPDEVVRVFDKFFRGHSQAGVGGAGLGLAIVKGVVEAHGGSVLARNRVGGGAEFAFTLPRRTLDGDG